MTHLKPLLAVSLLTLLTLTAFKKKDNPIKKLPKEFRELFSYIPQQIYSINSQYPIEFYNSYRDTSFEYRIESFYCMKNEVTNRLYKEFLKSYADSNAPEKEINMISIDSVNWREDYIFMEPLTKLYHFHPAYWEYPVVNVSHYGAQQFCKWYEEKINSQSEGIEFQVSLPTHEEWIGAAKGGLSFNPYPWGGTYLRNIKGQFLANFVYIGPESIHTNPETGQKEGMNVKTYSQYQTTHITAPSNSFSENDYGLFNMSGNVAEMISEHGIACGGGWRSTGFDIRCTSTMTYDSSQVDVGFRPIIKIVKE